MRRANILTEEESGLIRLHGVTAFLKSDLGQRMLKSSDVRREVNFTMRIDPHAPTMVQGIVDCAFKEDGEWILIDYKSDRIYDEEDLKARYRIQLELYRTALERAMGISIRETYLYSFAMGKAILLT